jgi:hypothetical protein
MHQSTTESFLHCCGGDADVEFSYGLRLISGDDTYMNKSLAADYFKLSADQGDAQAQFNYGGRLLMGDGISMNRSLAAHYFKLSADQGDALAQLNYGAMLLMGDGISMNKSLAAHYFNLSADQGHAQAQFNYGFMLLRGDVISMNKSLAAHYFKLFSDQGSTGSYGKSAGCLLRGAGVPINFQECENYLWLTAAQSSTEGQMRLGFCLSAGVFGRFDFTKARNLFDDMPDSHRFAAILRDSLSSSSDCDLVRASKFCQSANLFSILRCSSDDGRGLIRLLNADLSDFEVKDRFVAWREGAGHSFPYLVGISQAESHVFQTLPSDLLSCNSTSEMIGLIFRMYTIESSLWRNVNHFLRCFPISIVTKFCPTFICFSHQFNISHTKSQFAKTSLCIGELNGVLILSRSTNR